MKINVVLYHPEIPQNTGNIMRSCVGFNAKLHLIKPLGFSLDENKLKSAFYNTLIIADSNNLKTLGMVPISAGIYGFPLERCAEIAIETILNYKANSLEKCFIYCYNDKEYQVFTSKLKKYYKNNWYSLISDLSSVFLFFYSKINTYVFYKIMNLYLNISVLRVIDELMTKTAIKVLKR